MTQRPTILCVEDETLLLEDMKEELTDAGYDVLTAENGLAALQVLEEASPDMIICDMMMPEMDGPALLKYVRKSRPDLHEVPFIFLTAKATREDLLEGKKLGVDDYLTKPVDYDLLLATVEASLAQIERIKERNLKTLRGIYDKLQRKRAGASKLRVAFVSGGGQQIKPIMAAFTEMGCEVCRVPEEQLARKSFSAGDSDIVFLVYSKVVHYYLKFMMQDDTKNSKGAVVVLAPRKLTTGLREAIVDAGVDDYIDYPYRPLEIFKRVMKHLQKAA